MDSISEILVEILKNVALIFKIVYWYGEALFRQFVPPPMKSIDGETILVTGAVGGIGKEICRNLVKSGSNLTLVLLDLQKDDLDKFAEELMSSGSPGLKVYCFAIDLSSRKNIEIGCKQVKNAVGNITIIFNNAGIAPITGFLHQTDEQIEKTISINLTGNIWILRQLLSNMVSNNHGRIVTTCSVGGVKAASYMTPYYASKFGVHGFIEGMKAELLAQKPEIGGIKFTTVYPFIVQTQLVRSLMPNPAFKVKVPLGMNKFRTPEEVGKKMVDGMRREYEYISIPFTIPIVCFLEYVLPLKLRRALEKKYMDTDALIFKDAEEQERVFNAPFLPKPINNSSQNGNLTVKSVKVT